MSKQDAAAEAQAPKVTLKDFNILRFIGKGAAAKIFLVEMKGTEEIFAMKTLRKDVLLNHDLVEQAVQEKKIM